MFGTQCTNVTNSENCITHSCFGLLHFYPQPPNIFVQMYLYLQYLYHHPTLLITVLFAQQLNMGLGHSREIGHVLDFSFNWRRCDQRYDDQLTCILLEWLWIGLVGPTWSQYTAAMPARPLLSIKHQRPDQTDFIFNPKLKWTAVYTLCPRTLYLLRLVIYFGVICYIYTLWQL